MEPDHGFDLTDRQGKMPGDCARSLVADMQKFLLQRMQNIQQVPGLPTGIRNDRIQSFRVLHFVDRVHGLFSWDVPAADDETVAAPLTGYFHFL